MKMEKACNAIFHRDSYGYRPGVSAINAVATCRERCWRNDWVIDLDIVGCFDNIPHDLLLKAVDKHVTTKWERLYIVRWLQAGAIRPTGDGLKTVKGTPQGAVISPLLCNLFFHYALDRWMDRELPKIPFERYADDGVFHCRTKVQASYVLDRIRKRLGDLGLQLHPKKTRIVFCARGQEARNAEGAPRSFTFLGYDFKPREKPTGRSNLTFTPGVGKAAKKRLLEKVKSSRIGRRSDLSLHDIAKALNPMVRGWLNYFCHFRISDTYSTLYHLDRQLVRWMKEKYKIGTRRAQNRLAQMKILTPDLFVHWQPQQRKYGVL